MESPLHVLVYGAMDAGVCDTYRFGMHRAALAARGIEVRGFNRFGIRAPATTGGHLDEMFASESAVLDRSDLDWADVIVFRRFYLSHWSCGECALVSPDWKRLEQHRAGTGHSVVEPDRLIRRLFGAFETEPAVLRGRAIVYETDDDLLNVQPWNGVYQRMGPEREIIERMVRRADLVTVSTPVLAARHRRFNDTIRVIRNAIEPSWYEVDAGANATPTTGDPRLLYYAKPNRMRDYDVCRTAVDIVANRFPDARRVWLGAIDAPAGGPAEPVFAAVDEVGPYVDGADAFARSLAAARPDIGLAPLVGDVFDQAKSELHWLEYSMAGAATVATGMARGGPYDTIRDGVDGLIATSPGEWLDALTRLAESRDLREQLAGSARERILAESTVEVRADEWADAYRWAAAHAGRAVAGRVHGLGALPAAAIESEGGAAMRHRAATRTRVATAPDVLAGLRGARDVCWPALAAVDPVVSVIVPVVDDPAPLVERAVASILAGSHLRVDVVVAGAVAGLFFPDPRVRLLPVTPSTPSAPLPPDIARSQATGELLAAAVEVAHGPWIAPLSPEATFAPDHVTALLEVALEHELELVYGQAVIDIAGAPRLTIGSWPPGPDGVLTIGTELFARELLAAAPFDPEAWRDAETPGWAFWRSAIAAGARVASIDVPVTWLTAVDEAVAAVGSTPPRATHGRARDDRRARRRAVREARRAGA